MDLPLPEEVVDDVRARLSRIEGQVRGVRRMIDEERSCREVVQQMAAVTRALERARVRLLASGLRYCTTNPDEAEAAGFSAEEIEALFLAAR